MTSMWITAKGERLQITYMTTEHLQNCKRLLESGHKNMNNLSKPWTFYGNRDPIGIDPNFHEVQHNKPDYTGSPEYQAICSELNRRNWRLAIISLQPNLPYHKFRSILSKKLSITYPKEWYYSKYGHYCKLRR